jgi:hypothetical protein
MSETEDPAHETQERPPLKPWALSPKETALVENCSVAQVYVLLANGELEAYRDGTRTKITMESIERRRANLPRATYKLPPSKSRSRRSALETATP